MDPLCAPTTWRCYPKALAAAADYRMPFCRLMRTVPLCRCVICHLRRLCSEVGTVYDTAVKGSGGGCAVM